MTLRVVIAAAVALLTACTGQSGSMTGPPSGPPTGSSPSPLPGESPAGSGEIAFILEATYEVGEHVEVRIVNNGQRPYRYNSTGYEACDLTYRAENGREFIIPPGTHCDLIVIEEIKPGETVTLFEWDLDKCTKDRWGCVEEENLPPGTYTIEGSFRAADGGPPSHAVATFRIVQ
jgi:hypothetical protein